MRQPEGIHSTPAIPSGRQPTTRITPEPSGPSIVEKLVYEALQVHLLGVRAQTIHKIWLALLSRAEALVQQSRSISTTSQATSPLSSSASSTKPRGRAPKFTKEQTAALNALLARATQYSSEDKELIAHELNLTRDQVNRWVSFSFPIIATFCNARARRNHTHVLPAAPAQPLKLSSRSNNSTRSDSPSTQSERLLPRITSIEFIRRHRNVDHQYFSPSPSSSSSSLSTSPSSSSYLSTSSTTPVEDDPMEAYFDFPAYQPTETWPQQNQQQQDTPYLQPLPSQLNYQQRQPPSLLPLPSQQNYYHHPFDRSLPTTPSLVVLLRRIFSVLEPFFSPSNSNIGQGLWTMIFNNNFLQTLTLLLSFALEASFLYPYLLLYPLQKKYK
ncbi:hypothetical protein KEM48_008486 [Puccinia striiformis f. sp. tritici PST-130]|nr:hypothetical protein KEM48_008486 [Puccinia striiformis f. sp. tritici PST-130]